MFTENNTDALERPEGRELHPRERERLLAPMDRADVLSEARATLEAREYAHPELKARYLKALDGLHEEARIGFDAYRREVLAEGRA